MRTYICTGLSREYTVEANSPAAAKLKAGRLYQKEFGGYIPSGFYAPYFEPRVVDPKKPGPTSSLAR